MDLYENLDNGLCCSIDWLSFTIDSTDLIGTLSDFGFQLLDFYECPKGANGYKKMLSLHASSLRVLYDGNDNMGIHFDCSGSAVPELFRYYRESCLVETPFGTKAEDMDLLVLNDLFDRIFSHGHITRLDFAIDNMHQIYFRLDELRAIFELGRFSSKFRSWKEIVEKETNGARIGHTIYMGSRTSDLMLRIYDKKLEHNKRFPEDQIDYDWIRWELELKDDRANRAAHLLLENNSVGSVCLGILKNSLRIINLDDSNKSRCSTDIKWQRFLDNAEKLSLYVPPLKKSLEDKYNWVQRQVAPTLTGLIIANYGDIGFLRDEMELQAGRMKRELRDLVSAAHPDWEKCFNVFRTQTNSDSTARIGS